VFEPRLIGFLYVHPYEAARQAGERLDEGSIRMPLHQQRNRFAKLFFSKKPCQSAIRIMNVLSIAEGNNFAASPPSLF